MTETTFREQVQEVVKQIPEGRVMSYGQIAALLGHPRRSQAVGWVLHASAEELPWQRVVNRHGRMAPGCPGGMPAHADLLRQEGVEVEPKDFTCDIEKYRWWPPDAERS
jgi:methylated-DNA-protein-cysteine methyltransferase related protein